MNMRRASITTLVLGMFAAVPALAQTAVPTKVGVVNMIKVFNSMQEVTEIKAKSESDTKALNTAAQAHKAELINMGIPAARLTAKGYGDTKPAVDNSTPEGKANNRRVEFVRVS